MHLDIGNGVSLEKVDKFCKQIHLVGKCFRLKIHKTTNSYFFVDVLVSIRDLHQKKKLVLVLPVLGMTRTCMMMKKSRLRWFGYGYVERKDDNDWAKHCMTWEVEGIRHRGSQKRPDMGLY